MNLQSEAGPASVALAHTRLQARCLSREKDTPPTCYRASPVQSRLIISFAGSGERGSAREIHFFSVFAHFCRGFSEYSCSFVKKLTGNVEHVQRTDFQVSSLLAQWLLRGESSNSIHYLCLLGFIT